jgi:hypothetical protein
MLRSWHKTCVTVHGIEVCGSREFAVRTREALALLRASSQFELIRSHIQIIRQARRSGMKAWIDRPTFQVGAATWQHSPLWYAGAIAHDAYHAKLYRDAKTNSNGAAPPRDTWTGAAAEQQCLAFQRALLIGLNADEKTILYLDKCAENPLYQGHNQGWPSWLDYLKRWW